MSFAVENGDVEGLDDLLAGGEILQQSIADRVAPGHASRAIAVSERFV